MQAEIKIVDMNSLDLLKRLQENLHTLTGLAFDFVDITDNTPKKNEAKYEVELCRMVHKTSQGKTACQKCELKGLKESLESKKPVLYRCHLGLNDILVPLVVRKRIVGILTAGQFLMEPPDSKQFEKTFKRLKELCINISQSQAEKLYYELPVCSSQKVNAVIGLLTEFSMYITDIERRLFLMQQNSQSDKVNRAIEFIKEHFQEKLTIEDIAVDVCISQSHLRKLFHLKTMMSPITYLNNYRLDMAVELLKNENAHIVQVAYQVGFDSVSHFNHLFKRRFGYPPSQYRKVEFNND